MRFSKFAGNKPVCKSTDLKRKSAFLLWDTPYFILYSSLFLQKYPMFDEQVNYNLETPIRVLPDKYKTCLWQVLKLSDSCTIFESKMYNVWVKDVLHLNERCTAISSYYYLDTFCIQPFQFFSQTTCRKGGAAEGTLLYPFSDCLEKGGVVSAPFSLGHI